MTDKRIAKQHHATFESIRQQDAAGNEYQHDGCHQRRQPQRPTQGFTAKL